MHKVNSEVNAYLVALNSFSLGCLVHGWYEDWCVEMELVAEFEVEATVDVLLASMHQGTLLCAHMHPQAEILEIYA